MNRCKPRFALLRITAATGPVCGGILSTGGGVLLPVAMLDNAPGFWWLGAALLFFGAVWMFAGEVARWMLVVGQRLGINEEQDP